MAGTETENVDITICVATYRRPDGLRRLLKSLSQTRMPERHTVELLVVDNDANGSAREIVESFQIDGMRIRYCIETQTNLANARNRLVAEAAGQWLVFVDDDQTVAEEWLPFFVAMLQAYPADGYVGPVLAGFECAPPAWMKPDLFFGRPRLQTGALVAVRQTHMSNTFLNRNCFAGRRFDVAFGESGGEDTDFFSRFLREGGRLRWCEEAEVTEHYPSARLRFGWLRRRAFNGGLVWSRVQMKMHPGSALRLRLAARAVAGLLLFGISIPIELVRGRTRAAQRVLRVYVQAGHLAAIFGYSSTVYQARTQSPALSSTQAVS